MYQPTTSDEAEHHAVRVDGQVLGLELDRAPVVARPRRRRRRSTKDVMASSRSCFLHATRARRAPSTAQPRRAPTRASAAGRAAGCGRGSGCMAAEACLLARRHPLVDPRVDFSARKTRHAPPGSRAVALAACVPPGNSTPSDSGAPARRRPPPAPTFRPSVNVLTSVFEDNFDRADGGTDGRGRLRAGRSPGVLFGDAARPDAAADARARADRARPPPRAVASPPTSSAPTGARPRPPRGTSRTAGSAGRTRKNHGVWLQKVLPDQRAHRVRRHRRVAGRRPQGRGLGRRPVGRDRRVLHERHQLPDHLRRLEEQVPRARAHQRARPDRKEIEVDPRVDDPRERPGGQGSAATTSRSSGPTARPCAGSSNGLECSATTDPSPSRASGHDHFGFNDWEVKVCFDNVKVTPLP